MNSWPGFLVMFLEMIDEGEENQDLDIEEIFAGVFGGPRDDEDEGCDPSEEPDCEHDM